MATGDLAEILEVLGALKICKMGTSVCSPPQFPREQQPDRETAELQKPSETGRFKKVGRFTSCNKKRALLGMKEAK